MGKGENANGGKKGRDSAYGQGVFSSPLFRREKGNYRKLGRTDFLEREKKGERTRGGGEKEKTTGLIQEREGKSPSVHKKKTMQTRARRVVV